MAGLASCRDGNIYDTYQNFEVRLENLLLLQDRVLVEEIELPKSVGSILIPDVAQEGVAAGKDGLLRFGVVRATGRGDTYRRRQLEFGRVKITAFPERTQMFCKVGDVVLYDRRREGEVTIGGVRHSLIHEEQAVIGIVDGLEPGESPYKAA